MRTAGFVLAALGALFVYLAWTDKLGPAWTALTTGQAPSMGTAGTTAGATISSASSAAAASMPSSAATTKVPSSGNWLVNQLENGFGIWKYVG